MRINKTISKNVQLLRETRYHNNHKKTALLVLKNIERATNYRLTSYQKRTCDEYAHDVLGSKKYAPWLYAYTVYNQKFKEGWIPDNYFGLVVSPVINNGIGPLANVKTMTNRLINSPLLPDKLYKINDYFYDRNSQYIPEGEIKNILFKDKEKEYFVKQDNSYQGRGVFKLDYNSFDLNQLKTLKNFVIQDAIIQNSWFDEIVKGSVATVRITTVRVKNKVETRAFFLKVGREHTSHLKVESNLRVPIKDLSGELGEFASDVNWERHYEHPDTGFIFKGEKIPGFFEATKELEKIHEKFPHYTLIGWDVSIAEDGKPQIIEWNAAHPGIKFTEAAIGPSFKDLNWENLS